MASEIDALAQTQAPATPEKRQAKRMPLPAHLPRREIRHEPASTTCACGCQMKRVGEDVAAWSSYAAARRASKEPELFGKGSVEGLMAAETGDNACVPGAVIPVLTLAVPGSAPAAVLLAAMSEVAPSESGLASGMVNTSFMMGGSLGLAVLASLAAWKTAELGALGAALPASLAGGYRVAFAVGAVFAATGGLLALLLREPAPQLGMAAPAGHAG